ncbi:cytochrome P450 [Dunaliella salina]|uniref:Cytochrome P450 n=1 Tax=Dunaliella salina TaxID=3046 RepID=A0ABQ7G919_DUNSA|nr:cytochrome P450 [Dunaliella salina]|eukprot:KAF5831105.1 cytochrome P450 [Dunaliella salina]
MALVSRRCGHTGLHAGTQAPVPKFASQPRRTHRVPHKQRGSPCHALRADEEMASLPKLIERTLSGEVRGNNPPGSLKEELTRPVRSILASEPTGLGRALALQLARQGHAWREEAAKKLPVAQLDLMGIASTPLFNSISTLEKTYGKIFQLTVGPKSFVIISDPAYAKQILTTNSNKYSKGVLTEILDWILGTGLIPADGEIWKIRRRTIGPALHKKFLAAMVDMFGDSTLHGCNNLDKAIKEGRSVDMENFFSRLTLDIIGKAVFNYDFDSLTNDDPVIEAVYTVLAEAEHRSTAPFKYWELPFASEVIPRQRKCVEALQVLNNTLDRLIARSKKLVEEEDEEFVEEFLSTADPSILHFLIAAGENVTSKQLRDDLMTLLVAGHETTAAVLTWTLYQLVRNPQVADRVRQEPPVLIRRALEDDQFDGITVPKDSDIFLSVWNLHHSEKLWEDPEAFNPDRFGPLNGVIPNEVNTNFKYLPFGGGKRKCIGDQFALFESIVALAMLFRRYEFSLAPDAPPVGMTTGATIHTTEGLYMSITPRKVAPSQGRPPATSSASAGASKSSTVPA